MAMESKSETAFDDLAGDLDADTVVDPAQTLRNAHGNTFLEAASKLGGAAETYERESCHPAIYKCERCHGSGRCMGGRCFRCNGNGMQKRKPIDYSAAAVAKRAQSKARKEAKRAQEIASWVAKHQHVMDWINSKGPNHFFAASLSRGFAKYGSLTEGQIRAVEHAIVEDERRAEERHIEAERRAAEPAPSLDPNAIDLAKIPEGRYAIPDGETRLKIMIRKPDAGKWAGYVFVSDAGAYGSRQNYGMQKPYGKYEGKIKDALRVIVTDPKAAAVAYGRLTGTCCICGRALENEASIEAGIGPVCAEKFPE
jgi:hypothetical protein